MAEQVKDKAAKAAPSDSRLSPSVSDISVSIAKKAVAAAAKEPKDVKFQRLAVMRVNAAIKRIRHVGNLSNRTSYAYTEDQARAICKALGAAVEIVCMQFAGTSKVDQQFQL